ncbi:MAG: hypothetical protein LBG92_05265 [Prevotellaceae bacterium]|jgi:hypothetical protein|nr:hypothetical protein [Prevotellaceae bacterium]
MKTLKSVIIICLTSFVGHVLAGNVVQRPEIELSSKQGWKIWLDEKAQWQEDKLYLPGEFVLSELPVNSPTCGWDALFESKGKPAPVPTTVEEQFGTSHDWTYHGVSWFVREFEIDAEWQGKTMMLTVPEYHQRIEVYVNEKLVGYDAVGLLPYSCDISSAVIGGKKNRLAFRITSPGGNRGWEDYIELKWGGQPLVSAKDYSGVGGKIKLSVLDKNYIEDVFVKNLPPANANNIEIQITAKNQTSDAVKANFRIEIDEKVGGRKILDATLGISLKSGENTVIQHYTLPDAKQWSEDSPNMYVCTVTLESEQGDDRYRQAFGFRVFEIRDNAGKHDIYLNGKRIRFRSAIDWGVYAFNGMFPTDSAARRTIEAVKKVGHNSLNFHRQAGDVPVMDYADSLGVYIYEEPGAFHSSGQGRNIDESEFMCKQMYERLRRMIIRDRNHPSLCIYCLCNEDNVWSSTRKTAMELVRRLDDSRLIINSSGGNWGGFSTGGIAHIRPYENEVRFDYNDHHTVDADVVLSEELLQLPAQISIPKTKYRAVVDSTPLYWGETGCFGGTFNYPLLYAQGKANGGGYDLSMYESQARKAEELFETCRLKGSCGGAVQSVYDLTKQAGRGQYYTNGRLGQVIMCDDPSDGYAINGWSPGPDMPDEWSSAMVDQNRNLNASGNNAAYWNRPLQIAVFRQNGKYFNVGDTVAINIYLINEARLEAGNYTLQLRIKDGSGSYVTNPEKIPVKVAGGDVFAQSVREGYRFVTEQSWTSGYLTVEAQLIASLPEGQKNVADGAEQVLFKNRPSQAKRFKNKSINVIGWSEAEKALGDAGLKPNRNGKPRLILLGKDASESQWDAALALVNAGANMIVQLDSLGGCRLHRKGLLNEPIAVWGGHQSGHWKGNGSSYIEVFAGDQPLPSSDAISTRSWEATGNPTGFYPFRSPYRLRAYGLYFAHQHKRNPHFKESGNTLVTYGEIEYGKGHILLNGSYWIDGNNPFSDLLFFNMVNHYLK